MHEREIAFVVEECVTFLHEFAMDVQVTTRPTSRYPKHVQIHVLVLSSRKILSNVEPRLSRLVGTRRNSPDNKKHEY